MGDYKKRRRKYDDDDYDDDDDYRPRYSDREPKKSAFERILTPGTTTNNIIKTVATGVIGGGTVMLMSLYAYVGDAIAGASFLPITTLVAGAVTTACVWIFGRPKAEEERNAEISALNKQIKSLDQTIEDMQRHFDAVDKRLSNVEVIENFENRLANKEMNRKISSTLPTYEKSEAVAESSHMSPSKD